MRINRFPRFGMSWNPFLRGSLFYGTYFGIMGMFFPFLNVYLQQELKFSGRQLGVISMFWPLMTLVVAVPAVSFADRHHWRIPMLLGTLLSCSLLFSLAGLPHTFLFWVLWGLMMAMTVTPAEPIANGLIARMSQRHHLNYGTMRLCGSLGFMLTAICGGAAWERFGFHAMFLTAGLSFLLVLFVASQLEDPPIPHIRHTHHSLWDLRRDKGLVVLILTSFFVGIALGFSMVFDGLYMTFLGGTEGMIGLMFGIAALSELPAMQYRDALARRLNGPRTLWLSYLLLCLTYGGYVFAQFPWMLLVIITFKGFGFGLFVVSTIRLASERAPAKWSATVQSVLSASAFGMAPLLASPLGGELYDRFGPKTVFFCGSLCVGGAALLLLTAIKRGILTDVSMAGTDIPVT